MLNGDPLGCSNTQIEMFQLFMAHVLERHFPCHMHNHKGPTQMPNWNCCQLAVVLEGCSIGLTTASRCALHLVSGTILTGCSCKDVASKSVGKGWKAVKQFERAILQGTNISYLGKGKSSSKGPWEKGIYVPGRVKSD